MPEVAAETLPDPLPDDPLALGARWLRDAFARRTQPNPNAMTLSTVGADGQPSSRIVLCKGLVEPQGYLVFYTNYESRKGAELAAEPRAAALFHWDALHRQLRVEGRVLKSPEPESDAYFASRPWPSRLGAWASQQSRPVGDRRQLVEQLRAAARRFGTPPIGPDASGAGAESAQVAVPRPPYWGGYRLWIESLELWVEGEHRIHDRARWTRTLAPLAGGERYTTSLWRVGRLQP